MTYLDVRNEAVKQIKKYFDDRKIKIDVEASAGTLNEEEIRRLFIKASAIYVSLSEIDIENEYIRFVCYIVVRANQKDRIYDSGLAVSGSLLSCLKDLDGKTWGYSTSDISAQCLYSGSLDKINACLWACSWKWKIRVADIDGEIKDETVLDNFEGYDATHIVENKTVKDTVACANSVPLGSGQ